MYAIPRPHFKGQDLGALAYVLDFKELARRQGLVFEKDPTLGFEPLNRPKQVGVCNLTPDWREVRLDPGYWKESTQITRRMLVYHELTHCYCGRDHIAAKLPDGCPESVMDREILSDECTLAHLHYYELEMFADCNPYN